MYLAVPIEGLEDMFSVATQCSRLAARELQVCVCVCVCRPAGWANSNNNFDTSLGVPEPVPDYKHWARFLSYATRRCDTIGSPRDEARSS